MKSVSRLNTSGMGCIIRRQGRRVMLALACCACAGCATVSSTSESAPLASVPAEELLFDGVSLSGWTAVGGDAQFRVEDGCIVGTVGPGPNSFLRTERTFGDFILTLEFRWDLPVNSGVQIRSHQRGGNGRVFGYQCELDPSERAWTGGFYDEGRRGWLAPLDAETAAHDAARAAVRLDDWNQVRIEARGPRLRTWVNGVPCAVLDDRLDGRGFIALQVHSAADGQLRWRDICLQPLGRAAE